MTSYVNYAAAGTTTTPKGGDGHNVEQEARLADMTAFLQLYQISVNKKKRRQLLEMTTIGYESYKIGIEISHCCRDLDLERAYLCFQRVKAMHLKVPMHSYNNLLCLIAGLGELGHGSNTHRQGPVPYNLEYARDVYDYVLREGAGNAPGTAAEAVDPTEDGTTPASEEAPSNTKNGLIFSEAAYSALIRCHCLHQQLQEALAIYHLLDSATPRMNLKQRTYTTLLHVYSHQANTDVCETLWRDMQDKDHVVASEKEYISMLRLYFLTNRDDQFIGMLLEMMEELCYLQHEETLEVIRSFFVARQTAEKTFALVQSAVSMEGAVACNGQVLPSVEIENDHLQGLLSQLQSFAINRDPNHKYKPNNKIRDYISAQESLKAAARSNGQEGHVNVADAAEPVAATAEVINVVEATVEATNTSSKQPHFKNDSPEDRKLKWDNFVNYLRNRQEPHLTRSGNRNQGAEEATTTTKRRFDIIIDAANVGYYNQNYPGAPTHVDYIQIYQMVNHILGLGYTPLIIIHSRHFSEHILKTVHIQPYHYRDLLTGETGTFHTVYDVVNALKKTGNLYSTPKGFNDDWFWMFAAVKYCLPVITNDEMRDHHFQLLSPRYFTRWRERHRVLFEFFFRRNQPNDQSKEIRVKDANASSSDEDDGDNPYEEKKVEIKFDPQTRRPKVHFPLKFSFRMQYLDNEDHEGYYFPPLLSLVEEGKAVDDKKAQQQSSLLVSEELLESYEKIRFQHEWLCIYRKKSNVANSKRPREDEPDSVASSLGPSIAEEDGHKLKLQRQVTKDINE